MKPLTWPNIDLRQGYRKPLTWAEIDARMAEYHRQICECKTERQADALIEQAGWAYENMKLRCAEAWTDKGEIHERYRRSN